MLDLVARSKAEGYVSLRDLRGHSMHTWIYYCSNVFVFNGDLDVFRSLIDG
jgi:hypothetical protein